MAELQKRFKYGLLPKYPHLSQNESVIWNRFVEKFPDMFDWCDYDVIVGSGPEMDEDLQEEWQSNAKYLGSYKVDVVAYKNEKIFVIEIRPRAHLGAFGSLMSYMFLIQEQVGENVEVEPILVTDIERPDMRRLAKEHDIDYYVV